MMVAAPPVIKIARTVQEKIAAWDELAQSRGVVKHGHPNHPPVAV